MNKNWRNCIVAGLAAFFIIAAYVVKSARGVDLDTEHHLKDFLTHPGLLAHTAYAAVGENAREYSGPVATSVTELRASISVDAAQSSGRVNRNILGLNILGVKSVWEPTNAYSDFGGGLWDPDKNSLVQGPWELLSSLGTTTLRFPGGNGVQTYDWKKTIGPRKDVRFGLDEFLHLALSLGAVPVITLSYFQGGAEDTADLVEYLNAPADAKHPWAQQRAQNGKREPYGVVYFEFGNEVDNVRLPNRSAVTARQYADEYLRFQKAMKAVDGSVKLGAGLYYDQWNMLVLEQLQGHIDFGTLHIYPTPSWGMELKDMPAEDIFAVSLAKAMLETEADLRKVRQHLQAYAPGIEVPLLVTEYNGGFQQEQPVPYRHCLGNALVNAELIRVLMDPDNHVGMAHHWNFINEYWGMAANGFNGRASDLNKTYFKRPNYYVFEMYREHFGDELIPVKVSSPGYNAGNMDFFLSILRRDPNGFVESGNLLQEPWDIFPFKGIHAVKNENVLELEFSGQEFSDYYHAVKNSLAEPMVFYRLSGQIKTKDFSDPSGIGLEVQDARGWAVTRSGARTETVKAGEDWTRVETFYQSLEDTRAVRVLVRRYPGPGRSSGQVLIRDVRLEKFRPRLLSRIPYLSVSASKSDDGKKIFLMVLNKNMSAPVKAEIKLSGFLPSSKAMRWDLDADSVDATNEQDLQKVKLTQSTIDIPGNNFEMEFDKHSLTAVELNAQ